MSLRGYDNGYASGYVSGYKRECVNVNGYKRKCVRTTSPISLIGGVNVNGCGHVRMCKGVS